ncbi:MAG: undecaprenyl-diphosphate phosphatase [Chloroflexota bacterium]
MDIILIFKAALMGIVEGLTEFLPVSSTGHLILAGDVLGFPARIASTFEIFIQLGAIFAVIIYFSRDLLGLIQRAIRREPAALGLLINLLIAFIPAAVIGLLFHKQIKANFFSPFVVGISLVLGGVAMWLVELWAARQNMFANTPHKPKGPGEYRVSVLQSIGIGLAQIVSLVPGMSRAAWTIIGGMMTGLDRVTATRFSFLLAIPTLGAASIYELVKSLGELQSGDLPIFAIGLVVSFIVALLVIKFLLGYVAHNDFKPFAWYRIIVGAIMILIYR